MENDAFENSVTLNLESCVVVELLVDMRMFVR